MSEQSQPNIEDTPEILLLKSLTKKLGGSFGCYILSEGESLCTSRIPVNVHERENTDNNTVVSNDLWK
jgi:hypothetical protein